MDIRKVKKLIELLESSDIAEIEIKEGEESVRISRGSTSAPAPIAYQAPAPVPRPLQAPLRHQPPQPLRPPRRADMRLSRRWWERSIAPHLHHHQCSSKWANTLRPAM